MEQTEQIVKIPMSVLNTVIQYLATNPYNEVAPLIAAMQDNSTLDTPDVSDVFKKGSDTDG